MRVGVPGRTDASHDEMKEPRGSEGGRRRWRLMSTRMVIYGKLHFDDRWTVESILTLGEEEDADILPSLLGTLDGQASVILLLGCPQYSSSEPVCR